MAGYNNSLVGHDKVDNDDTHDAPNNGYLNNKGNRPEDHLKNGTFAYRQGKFYGLAEAYLNYVECLNEVKPGDPDILVYLNKIRVRAGVPEYIWGADEKGKISVSKDQAVMRDLIRRERRVELCCEDTYIRYTDIRAGLRGRRLLSRRYELQGREAFVRSERQRRENRSGILRPHGQRG